MRGRFARPRSIARVPRGFAGNGAEVRERAPASGGGSDMTLRATSWRACLFTACAIATLAAIGELFCVTGFGAPAWLGIKGLTEAASGQPYEERVSSVGTGGRADRAGVRAGDLVDVRDLSPLDRFGMIGQPLSNRPLVLPVRRGTQRLQMTVVPEPDGGWRTFPPDYLEALAAIWLSLFAWLLAVRKNESREGRLLTLMLACSALWIVTDIRNVAVPWTFGYVVITVVFAVTGPAAVALWAAFACTFATPSTMRRTLLILCYLLGIAVALVGIAYPLGVLTLVIDPVGIALAPAWTIPHFAQVLTALVCGLTAIVISQGAQRQRASWSIAGIALIFCVQPLTQYGQDVSTSYFEFLCFQFAQAGALLLAPIGLTYAMLSRRVFDTGFVLNRAAVFTGVSLVIVGIFVLAEWALSEWFSTASHTTNLAIGASLALILGLSVRAIHTRVDRVLDAMFFRKRHADEQAIRALARESAYITDPQILLSRLIAVLEEHADASSVEILLDDEAGHYGAASENDPAMVRLRASRAVLDLHDVRSTITGELAFPMLARGRLLGALVLGIKRSGEAYAPDESEAIAQLAHDAGAALDVLSRKSDQTEDPLRIEVQAMCEMLKDLPERIAGLSRSASEDAQLSR